MVTLTEEEMVEKALDKIQQKDREPISEWILQKRAEGKSRNTIRAYLTSISAVSKMSSKALLKSGKKDILNLQVKIRGTYKDPMLYSHVLRDFLRCHDMDSLALRISLNSKKSKKYWQDPAKVLNRQDVSRMLSVTRDIRDKALIALLWDSGARVHEIASIQIEDLERMKHDSNGKSKWLYTLWFRKQKVAGEERRIPLHESSSYILKCLRAHPDSGNKDAPLFVSRARQVSGLRPLTSNSIRDAVRDAARQAKIDKPAHPHAFRHGRATDLKMRGVSDDAIRAFMGWVRDSDMPMRYISRTQQNQMNEVASKLGYEPMPEPGPVEELEADDLLPPLEEGLTEDVLSHPDLVRQLDKLIEARFTERWGDWNAQVKSGNMSDAMDDRTERIRIAVKEAVQKVDKTAVVESIELSFPERKLGESEE